MKECEVLWKISINDKKNKQNEIDELRNIHLKIK